MNFLDIKNQMITFLRDELNNIGLKKAVLGISGGLDSAIVAILAKEAFGDNFKGVFLPSHLSSDNSLKDAKILCDKFNIDYEVVQIAPIVKGYFDNIKDATPLRIGNFSARARMAVLYDISAKEDAIVIGTSNKSEILLGYGTLYGDTACAINPIGEMYKSDEYAFGEFLGVPQEILDKKPSADLWEDQSDEDDLGYTYKQMDDVLKELIDNNKTKEELVANQVDEELIDMLLYRIKANSFKCKLPTIAKINWGK
jgi:NAD+ synthase